MKLWICWNHEYAQNSLLSYTAVIPPGAITNTIIVTRDQQNNLMGRQTIEVPFTLIFLKLSTIFYENMWNLQNVECLLTILWMFDI